MPFIHTLSVTIFLVLMAVWMHYEVLHQWPKIERIIARRPRGRILRLVLSLVVLHIAEIFLLGLGFWYLSHVEGAGQILSQIGTEHPSALGDYLYFAAAAYTTVGFGDLIPVGHIRLFTGVVALVGLILITWSASYTFLEMQRYWQRENDN